MLLVLFLVEVTVNLGKHTAKVKAACLIIELVGIYLNKVCTADDILKLAESHIGQELPYTLSHVHVVVYKVLAVTAELGTECRILGSYAYRAGVRMTLTHEQASQHDKLSSTESELTGTQQSHRYDVTRGLELTVNLNLNLLTQTVQDQSLLCLTQTNLRRYTGVTD